MSFDIQIKNLEKRIEKLLSEISLTKNKAEIARNNKKIELFQRRKAKVEKKVEVEKQKISKAKAKAKAKVEKKKKDTSG